MKSHILARRPEETLLLCCAHSHLESSHQEQVRRLLAAPLDWPYLARLAAQERVEPLLYWHLKQMAPGQVPPEVLARFETAFHQNNWLRLHLSQVVVEIVQLFTSEKIRGIPFKGVVLGAAVYDDPGLRQVGDIDLLVSPADALRAKATLVAAGFGMPPMTTAEEQAYLQSGNHFLLTRPETRTAVELHWRITPPGLPQQTTFEALWQRTVTVDLAGTQVRSLSPEDLLSYLCVHLVKHQWPNLRWLCDIDALIRRYQGTFDWEWFRQQPPVGGSRRMVWLGLHLTHSCLDTPLPGHIRTVIDSDPHIASLAAHMLDHLFQAEVRTPAVNLRCWLFQLAALETFRDRLRYLRHLVTPYHVEPRHYTLPLPLYPLYYLLRPLQFLWRLGRSHLNALKL